MLLNAVGLADAKQIGRYAREGGPEPARDHY